MPDTRPNLKKHTPLLGVLLIYLVLSAAYSTLVPVGEAPDEPAHLNYARFIAGHGRLPATLAERQAADYRADFPPLYYLIAAGPVAAVGNTPPTRLKFVGDTPRRLIPTNGQTIAAVIHTADEAWPWRGITLAWHLSRFISVGLMALAVGVTYAVAWQLTQRRGIALAAAALHAAIPQVLFIGSVLNEDGLLVLLSGLILLVLLAYTIPPRLPGLWHTFLLGALLGLASVSKYNAIPLWPLAIVWGGWLVYRRRLWLRFKYLLARLAVLLAGTALTGGWWFGFVWLNFNQVGSRGLVQGSLAAFTASTHDATLVKISAGASPAALPSPSAWVEWVVTLFKSFWGLFGGGGAIEMPGWSYALLALFCLAAAIPRRPNALCTVPLPFLLTPLFFLPLMVVRFIMTGGNIAETAQGRHLFPALPVIVVLLAWGLSRLPRPFRRLPAYTPVGVLILLCAGLSLYSLSLIRLAYPRPIPLHTTPGQISVENRLNLNLVKGVTLLGYRLGPPNRGLLPVTLVWQAGDIPTQDYLIDLTLTGPDGQPAGGWLGHPIGGRYPTRAWDPGDILLDTIPVPYMPGLPAGPKTRLTLSLLDNSGQTAAGPVTLASNITLPPAPPEPIGPVEARADGLSPQAPFTYRSTLSFSLPDKTPPRLIAPNGRAVTPAKIIRPAGHTLAHFIVAADWPGGVYRLHPPNARLTGYNLQLNITNRPRQFNPPPMQYTLNANFAGYITLLGYDMPERRVQPGGSFPLTLHLRAEQTMGQSLTIFNHLLDKNQVQQGGSDRTPRQYYTTLLWVPGEIVSDAYTVPVAPTAAPGIYWLDVGFYPADRPNFSLPLYQNGRPLEQNSVRLGPVKVGGPPPDVTVPQARPRYPVNRSFGPTGQITLLGFNLSGNPEPSQLTLFWQAQATPAADYTVFVHLLNAGGNLVAQADGPPAGGVYPTSLWDAGEIIVDPHPLPALPPGRYRLKAGLYLPGTGERLPAADSPDGSVELVELEIGQ